MRNINDVIWRPSAELKDQSYVTQLMRKMGVADVSALWRKSVDNIGGFWDTALNDLGVEWYDPYRVTLDMTNGLEWTKWFLGGKTNIVLNCVDRHLKNQPEKTAILWEGDRGETRSISYRELGELVGRCANGLRALGVRPGDSVGILMPMVPEVVVQLLGCFKVGAVAIPIFSGFGAEAIASRLSDAGAKVLFTSDVSHRRGKPIDIKENADRAVSIASCVEHCIVLQRGSSSCSWNSQRDWWWHDWISKQTPEGATERLDAEARSMIIFTSGTTGKPKGAIHTHAGVLATVAKEHRYAFNTDRNSRFFWFTDIGWMMGPWEIIGVTFFGGTLFLFEGAPDYPGPDRLWQTIERHGITHLGISPTAIRVLMRSGVEPTKSYAMPTLKILGSTGEPWDPESYDWFFSNVGKERCPIINISGGTEIMGCLLSPLPVHELKPCSLGGPGLGVDLDVFDDQGKPVRGGIGHLVCKQPLPSMTKGFLNNRERYIETYFSRWKGVWYHGDWAQVDSDNHWFLHGRSDDTIKVAGKRVGPVEYEAAVMTHDAVAEAAAVGVPDDLKGEVCVCFVIIKAGNEPTDALRATLMSCVTESLGKALAAKEIRFTASIPKTRSGKILRGLIRKVYLGEEDIDSTSVENPDTLRAIREST